MRLRDRLFLVLCVASLVCYALFSHAVRFFVKEVVRLFNTY